MANRSVNSKLEMQKAVHDSGKGAISSIDLLADNGHPTALCHVINHRGGSNPGPEDKAVIKHALIRLFETPSFADILQQTGAASRVVNDPELGMLLRNRIIRGQ